MVIMHLLCMILTVPGCRLEMSRIIKRAEP